MVRDDGLGFDLQSIGAPTAEGGFGLFSIRERLMSFRGDLQIESTPGAGTIVTATVPARLNESSVQKAQPSEMAAGEKA
jgi:signal transduction histidine kinase